MRVAFVRALRTLADADDRIVLLTGDLGFQVVETFAQAHPTRFFNVGVAEANMIGVATGLASQGFLPFCYSIASFASMRGYEQLRNGPIMHRLPVRVVGIGGGYAYGSAGMTHYALEDVALARQQPGLRVVAPADDQLAVSALLQTYAAPEPIYYRLTKDSVQLPQLDHGADVQEVQRLGRGGGVVVLTYGRLVSMACQAVEELQRAGSTVDVEIAVVTTLNPPPLVALQTILQSARVAITLEDHYVHGGIGTLAAEIVADNGLSVKLVRMGATEPVDGSTGSEQFMLARAGLSASALVARIRQAGGVGTRAGTNA